MNDDNIKRICIIDDSYKIENIVIAESAESIKSMFPTKYLVEDLNCTAHIGLQLDSSMTLPLPTSIDNSGVTEERKLMHLLFVKNNIANYGIMYTINNEDIFIPITTETKNNITGYINAFTDDKVVQWKFDSMHYIDITIKELKTILGLIMDHINNCFIIEQELLHKLTEYTQYVDIARDFALMLTDLEPKAVFPDNIF